MKKDYMTPEAEWIELMLADVLAFSIPTESGNQMPILTRKIVTDELNGDPDLDPLDQLTEPTEPF